VKEAAIARAKANEPPRWGATGPAQGKTSTALNFSSRANQDKGAEPQVLLRSSQHRPLMRIYVEASSPDLVQKIHEEDLAFVENKMTTATG
jgi:hypothetical protein